MVLLVRGTVLPEREERSLWIDGGVLREDPVAGADTVADGGWLVPGLVDVHTHPGAEKPGDPFDESVLRRHLADHAAAGVLLIRAPGAAARIPGWAHDAEGLPRVRSAGPWLATPGRFFPGWGRHVTEAELAQAAVQEAAAAAQEAAAAAGHSAAGNSAVAPGSAPAPGTAPAAVTAPAAGTTPAAGSAHAADTAPAAGTAPVAGWCKIIGDWAWDEPPVPLAILREVTSAVHAIGGKVSVHAQTAAGCAHAVAAGVDSLEHGMHLDPGLLDQMAAQGTALVPTLGAFAAAAFRVRAGDPGPRRDAFLTGWAAMPPTARAAYEAGVTVLAGTDTHPCGTVAEEVERLISAGLPWAAAVGAASWTARSWLGLPGLTDGAPADLVIYDEDPVAHPDILHHPRLIILRGQILA
jgi:imidazolonepropionase-like amidohydrolase